MVARVKHETCQLPGVDPRVRAYMDPAPALLAAARPAVESFAASFKFAPVEGSKAKRKHFWSDIAGADGAEGAAGAAGAVVGAAGGAPGGAAGASAGDDGPPAAKAAKVQTVGSVDPVGDFEAMVADPGLVNAAVAAMMARVVDLVTEGGTSAYYKKASACVVSLRRACVAHGESEAFNDFLEAKVKAAFKAGRHAEAWELVAAAGTTLVTSAEDSAVDVTAAEAAAFLADDAPTAPPPARPTPDAAAAEGRGESIYRLPTFGRAAALYHDGIVCRHTLSFSSLLCTSASYLDS